MRAGVVSAIVLASALSGCAPQPQPDDWTLEPIPFSTGLQDHPGVPAQGAGGGGEPIDLAFGMSLLAADGTGGFWASSAGSWLHVDADGATRARFTAPPDSPLSGITAMTGLSPTELLVVRDEGMPVLAVLDTTTMAMRDLPGEAPSGSGATADFGDFEFGDVAVQAGSAIVIRYRVRPEAYLDYEVLRVSLDDGTRTLLHSEPLALSDAAGAAPELPPVEVDVAADGAILVATPSARIVLGPDGEERSRAEQSAERPRVAVAPDGTALWWGGERRDSSVRGVVIGGSDDARRSVESRSACTGPGLIYDDALVMTDSAGAEHPLPFLCGANAAIRTGSSWVVAIGGEGDGVLVRLAPPSGS